MIVQFVDQLSGNLVAALKNTQVESISQAPVRFYFGISKKWAF